MKDNRNNTLLLTVIAIATLLVAVIGATFAYFSSSVNGDDPSIIKAGSALIELNFDSDDGADLSKTGIQPKGLMYTKEDGQQVNEMITDNAIISKTFKLTQSNSTDKDFTYDIYLIVDNSTFTNDNPANIPDVTGTPTSISAKLIGSEAVGSASSTTVYVPSGTDTSNVTLTNNDGTETVVKGVKLGTGTFTHGQNNVTHEYTVEIYFLDSNKAQDGDRGKDFQGHIAISSGAAANALQ